MTKRKLSFSDDERASPAPAISAVESPLAPSHPDDGFHDDMVDAAEALTHLHTVTPVTTPPPQQLPAQQVHPIVSQVERLSKTPLVQGAAKYYESSKRNYPHFNYAARMVERAALPVVSKIEVNLNSRHQSRLEAAQVAEFEHKLRQRDGDGIKKRRLSEDSTASSRQGELKTVSAETKKRLQFCLHILKLANDNINDKVHYLQEVMDEREQRQEELAKESVEAKENKEKEEKEKEAARPEAAAESEIVCTVKKIIHLISNFKPSSLSTEPLSPVSSHQANSTMVVDNQLKSTIRDIILRLPSSVATQQQPQRQDRIFVFAKESLNMISKLTNVLNEQLEMAEHWMADGDDGGDTPHGPTPGSTTPGGMSDISRVDSQSTLASASATGPCKRISIDDLTES
ncbi:hypothetical protein DIURU_004592 [Diutina rugosa]|uniref:Uncharacterized protein n=1 Tax=Diutina rugosa TaxID=5481 RepID=A0A642UL37_DIURU|nr:uncharacterized protein DIURU_004592 [Diutina rugosa]KAA8898748.1 hypothetical protein DIURU_004592 [Diutina rugosa]